MRSLIFLASLVACATSDSTYPSAPPKHDIDPASNPAPKSGDAKKGQIIYAARCSACHTLDGSPKVGPTWKGLFGEERKLSNGRTVIADEAYVERAMREPSAQIVAGYPNQMPKFNLSDQQLRDVIAFMKSIPVE